MSEQEFVREQYSTDANLRARIELHVVDVSAVAG